MINEIEFASEIPNSTLVDEEEIQEITKFFSQVELMKNKILSQLKQEDVLIKQNCNLFTREELTDLLIKNLNLLELISKDTIRIYVESFFKENEDAKFEVNEESLEGFLTSIMIFSNN